MSGVIRLGARVALDPDPAGQLAAVERQSVEGPDTEEAALLLDEYARGQWRLGKLHCWVDADWPSGVRERRDGIVIDGVWLRTGDLKASREHAAEMLGLSLEEIRTDLREAGIDVALQTLEKLPTEIELDPQLTD